MGVILDIGDGDLPVVFNRHRAADVEHVSFVRIHQPRLNRDHVTRTAKSVAAPEGVANRYAFHAATHAERQAAGPVTQSFPQRTDRNRQSVREASAPQVLVGCGDDVLSSGGPEGLDAGCVLRAEKPRSAEIAKGVEIELAVGFRADAESPGAIAGLDRFVKRARLLCSIGQNGGSFRVVDSRWQLQLRRKRNVAVALGRRTPYPGLYPHQDISNAARPVGVDAALRVARRGHAWDGS